MAFDPAYPIGYLQILLQARRKWYHSDMTTPRATIDDLLLGQPLTKSQRTQLLHAEQASNHALLSRDALRDLEELAVTDPLRRLVAGVLGRVRKGLLDNIEAAPQYPTPTFDVITGAPGSGKSHLVRMLEETRRPGAVYLCGDVIKKAFKTAARANSTLAADPRWQNDAYLHRLTAAVSWELLEFAKARGADIILEMLGSDADADARMCINFGTHQGYAVHVHHVATSTARAVEGAIKRYFGDGPEAGRHVGLTEIAGRQEALIQSFINMDRLVREGLPTAQVTAYDNRTWQMTPIYTHQAGLSDGAIDPAVFLDAAAPSGLWFKGANHTADLVVLAQDAAGKWGVATITRGKPPFLGHHAFPGGFVNTDAKPGQEYVLGFERPIDAARREFAEETLFEMDEAVTLTEVGIYDHRLRDPRNTADAWVVSHAFAVILPQQVELNAADDADEAPWVALEDLMSGNIPMAFDHAKILRDATRKLGLTDRPRNKARPKAP